MARKRYDDDVPTEHHERWLISYADLITLLFAFFVVMYAISIVNEGKYQVLSDALGDAFGGRGAATQVNTNVEPVLPLSHIINRKRNEAARREQERMGVMARELSAVLAGGLAGVLGVWLLTLTDGTWQVMALYVAVIAAITTATTFLVPETRGRDLLRTEDAVRLSTDEEHTGVIITEARA